MTDPLLAAGVLWCFTCRIDAYPTDAAWLDDDLLIATYPPSCPHQPGLTTTVTPSQMTPIPDRCTSHTRAGTRCRNRPMHGQDRCHSHINVTAGGSHDA